MFKINWKKAMGIGNSLLNTFYLVFCLYAIYLAIKLIFMPSDTPIHLSSLPNYYKWQFAPILIVSTISSIKFGPRRLVTTMFLNLAAYEFLFHDYTLQTMGFMIVTQLFLLLSFFEKKEYLTKMDNTNLNLFMSFVLLNAVFVVLYYFIELSNYAFVLGMYFLAGMFLSTFYAFRLGKRSGYLVVFLNITVLILLFLSTFPDGILIIFSFVQFCIFCRNLLDDNWKDPWKECTFLYKKLKHIFSK